MFSFEDLRVNLNASFVNFYAKCVDLTKKIGIVLIWPSLLHALC